MIIGNKSRLKSILKIGDDNLINIGELVKVLSMNFRSRYTDISWKSIAGMRDIVAHKYQSLRMEDIWITIQDDIPVLKIGSAYYSYLQ